MDQSDLRPMLARLLSKQSTNTPAIAGGGYGQNPQPDMISTALPDSNGNTDIPPHLKDMVERIRQQLGGQYSDQQILEYLRTQVQQPNAI